MIAIIKALQHFRNIILGCKILIFTDNRIIYLQVKVKLIVCRDGLQLYLILILKLDLSTVRRIQRQIFYPGACYLLMMTKNHKNSHFLIRVSWINSYTICIFTLAIPVFIRFIIVLLVSTV